MSLMQCKNSKTQNAINLQNAMGLKFYQNAAGGVSI